MVAERDAEIEMIITRLSSEGSADTSDLERRHRLEIERLKTESSNSIRDLRQEHSLALDRVVEYQNRVAEMEKEQRMLRKDLSANENAKMAKELVIVQQRGTLERLQVNERELSGVIRKFLGVIVGGEFQVELEQKKLVVQDLTKQIETQNVKINEMESRHCTELSRIVQEKESTLEMVESQVKKTLKNKDEAILSLKRRVEELCVQNGHYEEMIETQRGEIVSLVK
jgi:hypothetical protein